VKALCVGRIEFSRGLGLLDTVYFVLGCLLEEEAMALRVL
jgi:hypothetical protein